MHLYRLGELNLVLLTDNSPYPCINVDTIEGREMYKFNQYNFGLSHPAY